MFYFIKHIFKTCLLLVLDYVECLPNMYKFYYRKKKNMLQWAH